MTSTTEAAPDTPLARDIVVIGGSAGAVDGIMELARGLPGDLPAAVFVAIHIPPAATSALPRILTRAGALPAQHAGDGERFQQGRIYVAPPDRHLTLDDGVLRVIQGPRENGLRPAIDPLFRSAAASYGARVAAVLLSGVLDDGTAGLMAVKRGRGLVIIQDPATALFTGILESALANVEVDHCVAPAEAAALVARLARGSAWRDEQGLAAPSVLACPDCGGILNELPDAPVRFRCHTGHGYSAESLLAGHTVGIESALRSSLRALEDKTRLCETLARLARERRHVRAAEHYAEQAATLGNQARLVREMLTRTGPGVGD